MEVLHPRTRQILLHPISGPLTKSKVRLNTQTELDPVPFTYAEMYRSDVHVGNIHFYILVINAFNQSDLP